MNAGDVLLYVALVVAVILAIYMIGSWLLGYPIFGCGGDQSGNTSDSAMTDHASSHDSINAQQSLAQTRREMGAQIQNTYASLDALSVKLRAALKFFEVQKSVPTADLINGVVRFRNEIRSRPSNLSTAVSADVEELHGALHHFAPGEDTSIFGPKPSSYDLATRVKNVLCAVNSEKKRLLSMNEYHLGGKPILTDSQRLTMINDSSAAFMQSGDLDALAPEVRSALKDVIDFNPADKQLVSAAAYNEGLYRNISKSKDMEARHQSAISEVMKYRGNRPSVGRTRVIEEEISRSPYARVLPTNRVCSSGGIGAYTMPDAPNTSLRFTQSSSSAGRPDCGACHWAKDLSCS